MNIREILLHEDELRKNALGRRKKFFCSTSLDNAKRIWYAIGQRLTQNKYVVDESNKETVIEVLKWLIMDESFKGDLHRGIWIIGEKGTGKSLTMEIFIEMLRHANKIVANYTSLQIVRIFEEGLPKDRLFVSPLYIDDLGTEQPEVKVFGTPVMPVYEVLNERYASKRFMTFVTSNLDPGQIKERYGDRISDRIREMFNVMVMTGESRRK